MRVAAAAVGGIAALFGILISGFVLLITFIMMASAGPFTVLPVDLAMIGTESVVALFYAAGLVGVGLLLARSSRWGVYLMLVAAVGSAVVRLIQPLLVRIAGNVGMPERFIEDTNTYPYSAEPLVYVLIPAAALLLAFLLGTLAIRSRQVS